MQLHITSDWFHAIRLFITFIMTASLGAHAFHRFKMLAGIASPKLWAFLLYAMAFVLSSTLNFVALMITVATRTYGHMPAVSLGPFTVLLVISYMAFAVTRRPSRA